MEVEEEKTEMSDDTDDSTDGSDEDSSDQSDVEEDAVDDAEAEKKIAQLQKALEDSPYSYNLHVEVTKLLRKKGDVDQLRRARERMSTLFPLTEELWLNWLRDEIKQAEATDRPKVISLFERAVKDYMSVAVWLEYVQYSIGGMAEDGGLAAIRDTFERALTAVGIHVAGGSMLWEAYREFECAMLAGLQPSPGSVSDAETMKQIDTQTKRVAKLFQRQLSIPLIDMENTYREYEEWLSEWLSEEVDTQTKQKYEKAKRKLQQLMPFENELTNSESPHLSAYTAYTDHEIEEGDPVRVLCIFERAIVDNCLQSDLWIRYVNYVDTTLKSTDTLLPLYERAVRNCPWSAELWIGQMQVLEHSSQAHDQIVDVLSRAMASGFSQGSEYLRMWTAYLDYLRRRVRWNEEHDRELEALQAGFEQAICHLSKKFPVDGDPYCTLTQYWAFIEAKYCGNMSKARELWSGILQAGFSSQAQMCLEYVRLERAYGNAKHCRKLFQRVLNSVSDWPESISEAYIQFEREEGDLESYREAVQRCEVQMKRVHARRAKEAEKEAELAKQKKAENAEKKKQAKNKSKAMQAQSATQNKLPTQTEIRPYSRSRPIGQTSKPDTSVDQSETRAPADSSSRSDVPQPAVYVRGQKRKLDEDAAEAGSQPAVKSDGFRVPPPPGYKPKPQTTMSESSDMPTKKVRVDESDGSDGAHTTPSGHTATKDSCTAFVSNLDYAVTAEQIREIFCNVGEIEDVRLITTYKGKSKGYAYVQFKDEFPVGEALKMDRRPISGRPMFVSPCNRQASTASRLKFNTGLEKNKLFLKGLPLTATKSELEELFAVHGKIKDVRIVTYRNGMPKGLAYVEYENETFAAQAVLKMDEYKMGEHTISVAISNPPARNTQQQLAESSKFVPSLGGGKKETADHGKARTQLTLVPRSVQRPHSSGSAATPASGSSSTHSDDHDVSNTGDAKKLSNADFRNMLLH